MGNKFSSKNISQTEKDDINFQFQNYQYNQNEISNNEDFSVLSYNILAKIYTLSLEKFTKEPPKFIDISYRSDKICKIIQKLDSDIICLQEVDELDNIYHSKLISMGYDYQFYTKKRDIKVESILIGYKKDKFKLIETYSYNYSDLLLVAESNFIQGKQNFTQGTGILALKLFQNSTGKQIIICNTHLFWNPHYEKVKFFEIIAAMNFLQNIMKIEKNENIIWCGDFNSKPNSNVCHFIHKPSSFEVEVDSYLQYNNKDLKVFEQLYKNLYKSLIGNLRYKFYSVYSKYFKTNFGKFVHPKYTNYTKCFKGTLDYIFFNKKSQVRPIKLLQLPFSEIEKFQSCPNEIFPSDHMPIMAYFKWLQQ